jgi:hypothetical protein
MYRRELFIMSNLLALDVVEFGVVIVDRPVCGTACCIRKLFGTSCLCIKLVHTSSSHGRDVWGYETHVEKVNIMASLLPHLGEAFNEVKLTFQPV